MSRVSIVVPDNIVVVDGYALQIDCSELAQKGYHAIQWENGKGHVELVNPAGGFGTVNEPLNDFGFFQDWVDTHSKLLQKPEVAEQKAKYDAAVAAATHLAPLEKKNVNGKTTTP